MENFAGSFADDFQHLYCDTLGECFTYVLNYGLRLGGGIGEALKIKSTSDKDYLKILVLQLSFF